MRSYGLAKLALMATTHPSPPLGGTGDPDVTVRRTRPSPRRTFRSKAQSWICKTCASGPRSSQKLYYSWLSSILKSGRSVRSSRRRAKSKFLLRQVNTAIRKTSNWGDFPKRLEQMYPVYETNLRVHTEIQELPRLPKYPAAAGISEFVAQVGEVVGHMNPTSYGPTEPHPWQVGKAPPKTRENCRETSERIARTHCYDDSIHLLIGFAMEREDKSNIDKYLHSHSGGRPLLRRVPDGGHLNPNPILGRAELDS